MCLCENAERKQDVFALKPNRACMDYVCVCLCAIKQHPRKYIQAKHSDKLAQCRRMRRRGKCSLEILDQSCFQMQMRSVELI